MPAGSRGDWVRELGPGEGTIAKWKAETLVDDSLLSSSLYLLFGTGSRVTRSSDIFRFICVITWLFFYMLTQFYIKQMPNTRISQIKTWLWEIIVPTAAVCGLWTLLVEAAQCNHQGRSLARVPRTVQPSWCCRVGLSLQGWSVPCWGKHSHASLTWQLSRATQQQL